LIRPGCGESKSPTGRITPDRPLDLRECGGGSSPVIDIFAGHITDQPFRTYSAIRIRLSPQQYQTLSDPTLQNWWQSHIRRSAPYYTIPSRVPLQLSPRFDGEVVALTSGFTYSAASDFAAALQDSGLALIVGSSTDAGCSPTSRRMPNRRSRPGARSADRPTARSRSATPRRPRPRPG